MENPKIKITANKLYGKLSLEYAISIKSNGFI